MTLTLADGLPIWEGQAVRFGSPGRDRQGVYYVHGTEAGKVHLGWDHFVDPGALVCDLGHRPTFAEAGIRIMQATLTRSFALDGDGFHEFIDGVGEVLVADFDNPAALLSLWQSTLQGDNR